jgi:hypothetical protein
LTMFVLLLSLLLYRPWRLPILIRMRANASAYAGKLVEGWAMPDLILRSTLIPYMGRKLSQDHSAYLTIRSITLL